MYSSKEEDLTPLPSTSETMESVRPCPKAEATFCGQVTNSWMNEILEIGYKRPLEKSDLYALREPFLTSSTKKDLSIAWQNRLIQSNKNRKPYKWPLIWSISDAFGTPFYLAGLMKFVGDAAAMASPYLLRILIRNIQTSTNQTENRQLAIMGYTICGAMFLLQLLNTLLVNYYFTTNSRVGLKVRTALNGMIYEKSLGLSGRARQQFSTGQQVNLMANDSSRVEMVAVYLHYIWSGPFQIIVIMSLLYRMIGISAFVGFFLFGIFIPIQSKITAWLSLYRKETSQISDKRVRLMQEVIQGIRVIKYYAWEKSFLKSLFDLRNQELIRIKKSMYMRSLTSAITFTVPAFASILTFLCYRLLGNQMTPEIVFPVMTFYNLLRLPLVLLPMVLTMMVDAKVALKRIQEYLLAEELDFEPEIHDNSSEAIVVEGAIFEWEEPPGPEKCITNTSTDCLVGNESKTSFLSPRGRLGPINMRVPKGSLVAVVGQVGVGKSSLLNALVGEMKHISGRVTFSSSIGYSPQQAWIQNKNVRENILFGHSFDESKYTSVIKACALEKDLRMLPDGDLTEIGEKGVNLSGGQKQRISLARIIYSDADIILLDDPLSAVDAHVGKHIFDQCITGILKGKTRILVTHQLHHLPKFDYIIFMKGMQIVEQGTFSELVRYETTFSNLMKIHGGFGNGTKDLLLASPQEEGQFVNTLRSSRTNEDVLLNQGVHSKKEARKLMTTEERVVGAVALSVYMDYIKWAGGAWFAVPILILIILSNATKIMNDFWLSFWTESPPRFNLSPLIYGIVYLSFGIAQAILNYVMGLMFGFSGARASSILHHNAATKVIRSPVLFFDQNPLGRIINRFSKDIDTVDNQLPESFRSFVTMGGFGLSAIILISLVSWAFTPPMLVCIAVYYMAQKYYRSSSRELKRLDALSRSPLYAQFSETLTGLATIRAFRDQDRFIRAFGHLADVNNRPIFLIFSIQRWLAVRLESIGNFIVLSASLSCYFFRNSAWVTPSSAGLAIGYALSISGMLNWIVRMVSETESNIISSERLGYYAGLKAEDELLQDDTDSLEITSCPDISPDWPSAGSIRFKDVTMKYRPDLPPVLADINLTINAGERIGIVGRTGAGKSSIMAVLFQIIRQSAGTILIDDVDITSIGLECLRRHISIIPQDPVVFAGTVRSNLDPFSEFEDSQVWAAIKQSYLYETVSEMEGGLDASVQEGGENLSIGQRQLLCLARAILRRNCIIVLDEATANIDLETDALIQQSLRTDFAGCTLLTIAHRLNTVIDYDKILVLEKGRIAEFGTPKKLLADPESWLSGLVRETGASNEALLRAMAN